MSPINQPDALQWWECLHCGTRYASGTTHACPGKPKPQRVTATYDGLWIRLYVDGVLVGSGTGPGTVEAVWPQ